MVIIGCFKNLINYIIEWRFIIEIKTKTRKTDEKEVKNFQRCGYNIDPIDYQISIKERGESEEKVRANRMYFITHNSVKRRKVADLMDHDSHPYEREKVCHNGMKVEMDFRGIVNNSNLHIP